MGSRGRGVLSFVLFLSFGVIRVVWFFGFVGIVVNFRFCCGGFDGGRTCKGRTG